MLYRLECMLWSDEKSEKYKKKLTPHRSVEEVDLSNYVLVDEDFEVDYREVEFEYCRRCNEIINSVSEHFNKSEYNCTGYCEKSEELMNHDVIVENLNKGFILECNNGLEFREVEIK